MNPLNIQAAKAVLLALVIVCSAAICARVLAATAIPRAVTAAAYSVKDIAQNLQAIKVKANQARADAARPWQEKYAKAQKELERQYSIIHKNGYAYDLVTDTLAPLEDPKKPLTFSPKREEAVDLDKLSRAVACAETSCGKDGTARGRNNAHGIMCWPNGKRTPCYFPSIAASHAAFKKIWAKSYKRFPDVALAQKYTGNDHPDEWLATVIKVYNSL